ncbi:MAG: uridine kinase [Trueperaceae bacterium]
MTPSPATHDGGAAATAGDGPLVIGLAGGTGSGKSTVAHAIVTAGSGRVAILPQDAYYRDRPELPFEARAVTNYDEPSAFDTELLVAQLDDLIAGRPIQRPVYDFERHQRSGDAVHVAPSPVLVVEGILVLHEPALRERMSLQVFVDAPPDERFIRRLERDVQERGRSAESVIAQYRRTVKPMHDLFVEPTKQHADLIVPEGGSNRVALDVMTSYVERFVHDAASVSDAAHGRDREANAS